MAAPIVAPPTFEHHHSGQGLGTAHPRISWKFIAPEDGTLHGWKQTGCEIEITWHQHPVNKVEVFKIDGSDQSTFVHWPSATELGSRRIASVRVRCLGLGWNGGKEYLSGTEWSRPSIVEAGLLRPEDWSSWFITSSRRIGSDEGPLRPLRFRKEFSLDANVASNILRARLYITGLGVFKAYINGTRTSDEEMAPGWTSYNHRLNYRVHDVTSLLRLEGDLSNVIAVEVAEGWYAGRLGFEGGTRFNYGGKELAVMAQLEITLKANSPPWILGSSESWSASASALTSSEIYDGEVLDAREEHDEWTLPGTDCTSWIPCKRVQGPPGRLVAPEAPPVRIVQTIPAVSVAKSHSGKTIIDFGQNLVGKIQVGLIDLPAGQQMLFKHAEVMEHGELGTRPLRQAKATDAVISAGRPIRNWTPQFTFHGFRYVQVEGWPPSAPPPQASDFTALVLHTDLTRRGTFSCSNALVNQLYHNILWSMKGNFLSIPTDCPQRDERLGWTGDIQVFAPTASFLYDTTGMLKDWLQDLAAEQLSDPARNGVPQVICPEVPAPGWPLSPFAVWDDVVVLLPWTLYTATHDRHILQRQYDSMAAYLGRGIARDPSDGLWDPSHWQLGDWLDPAAPPDDPSRSATDSVLVADAYLVHITTLFAEVCRLLGRHDECARHVLQAAELKAAFQHKYITPAGFPLSSTQTALSLVIQFALHRSPTELLALRARLSRLVRAAHFRITTGFVGTPLILPALTSVRLHQLAYRMLLEKGCPSWLYPVTQGATTVWERWDSMLPDGSINPGEMTSFNHYALGAVGAWLHDTLGGISPAEPGWKTVQVRPVPGGSVTSASVAYDGPYGLVRCEWRLEEEGRRFKLELEVPPNSRAVVTLPSEVSFEGMFREQAEPHHVVESGVHRFECEMRGRGQGEDGEEERWPPRAIVAPHRNLLDEDDIA